MHRKTSNLLKYHVQTILFETNIDYAVDRVVLKIGTTNLLRIEKGSVRIQQCPKLCFVDTVDWKSLGAEKLVILDNNDENDCPKCPSQCKDSCWNSTHCQVTPKDCHSECLGCLKPNSTKDCIVCKNFEHDGECVSECPPDKYGFSLLQECYTKEECENLNFQNRTSWTHGKECITQCPPSFVELVTYEEKTYKTVYTCRSCEPNCIKECEGGAIESIQKLRNFKGCTHINSSLCIRKADVELSELQQYLGAVRNISGSLEIFRTVRLSSLDFLENLTYIGMNDANYSIFMYENQNLQKLWKLRRNLTLKGNIRFHDNPQLCLSEIEALARATNVTYSTIDVSPFSNGDEASCINVTLITTVIENSTTANISWQLPKLNETESYVSFTVYYKEEKARNATIFNSIAVCVPNEWDNVFVFTNFTTLYNLLPNSTYAYYIKLHIRSEGARKDAQSDMKYFQTLSDDPDGFEYLVVTPIDHQSVSLVWKEPLRPNGVLDSYVLDYINVENPYLYERDYCRDQRSPGGDEIKYNEDDQQSSLYNQIYNRPPVETPANKCLCEEPPKPEYVSIVTREGKSQLCNELAKSISEREMCKDFEYYSSEPSEPTEIPKIKLQKRDYEHREISPKLTSYNITNLTPFTLYVFYFSACNKGSMNDTHCSGILQRFARTKKLPQADVVESINVASQGESSLKVSWRKPKNPNSPVVAYHVNIKLNSPTTVTKDTCIPMNGSIEEMSELYSDLSPGEYLVSVKAETLAGVTEITNLIHFRILSSNKHIIWISVLVVCLIIVIGSVSVYIVFKRRRMDFNALIPTINPDYEGASYIPDHWEMERSDIELVRELGRGNFGTVYQGLIKSRNQSCAVKVVNEAMSVDQRMEFLVEASMMKSFNDCYHVVKLLGVVSMDQPVYVIMELMERGDLKKYLRRFRDSSHNLTSVEIYRMAIEIADGMTYLSAKKFVHRDLAARNCMVASDRTVKVGDFGMARDIYTTDYYRKETKGLLPVRWMAPESLADGVFTTDSDVWSFGVVLWEIATLAEQPYQGLTNENVRQFIISRGRLPRPSECSDLLYEVMRQCWSWRPSDRPSFWDIVERLENKVSEDFKLVAFVYSREAALYSCDRADNPAALAIEQRSDLMCHYNVSDEEVHLTVGGVPRRPSYLQASLSHRRFSPPSHSRFSPPSHSSHMF